MIQRIQSVYLLFAAIVIFALYFFPFAHSVPVSGVPSTIKVTGIYQETAQGLTITQPFTVLTVVTALVGLVPIVLIFLFRNRKMQTTLCYLAIFVIIGFSFWVASTVKAQTGGFEMTANNFGVGALLSSISIILLIMAAKAIQRDDKLVRSADRLR